MHQTHTRTNSKRCGESLRLIWYHPAKLYFSAFPCMQICQHKHSAALHNKQSPTVSSTHAKCTNAEGHLRFTTPQMAFVPVTWLGAFVLSVCKYIIQCMCYYIIILHIYSHTIAPTIPLTVNVMREKIWLSLWHLRTVFSFFFLFFGLTLRRKKLKLPRQRNWTLFVI